MALIVSTVCLLKQQFFQDITVVCYIIKIVVEITEYKMFCCSVLKLSVKSTLDILCKAFIATFPQDEHLYAQEMASVVIGNSISFDHTCCEYWIFTRGQNLGFKII